MHMYFSVKPQIQSTPNQFYKIKYWETKCILNLTAVKSQLELSLSNKNVDVDGVVVVGGGGGGCGGVVVFCCLLFVDVVVVGVQLTVDIKLVWMAIFISNLTFVMVGWGEVGLSLGFDNSTRFCNSYHWIVDLNSNSTLIDIE